MSSEASSRFEIVNVAWPRQPLSDSELGPRQSSQDLVAIEQYSRIEYRSEDGSLFHAYELPASGDYFYQFRHYFRYFGTRFRDLRADQLKFKFIFYTLLMVRKLASRRRRISILEIGVTLGENYYLLMDAIRSEGLDVEINYVG